MSKVKTQKNLKSMLYIGLIITFIAMISISSIVVNAAEVASLPDNFTANNETAQSRFDNFIRTSDQIPVSFAADITATVDGTVYQLYCLEHEKDFPDNGTAYSKNTENNDNYIDDGIIYILTSGYNQNENFLPTYTDDERKYITQMAIWYYQGIRDNGMDYAGSSSLHDKYLHTDWITAIKNNEKYGAEIIKLATDALTANNNPNSIAIDESAIKPMSKQGNYYETDYITPIYTGNLQSYTVTLPENAYEAKVIDEDGKEVTTAIPAGKKFKIRVNASKVTASKVEIKDVVITGTFTVKTAYSYLPSDTGNQTLLYAAYTTETKPVPATFQIINTPKTKTPDTATNIPLYVYIVGAIAVIAGIMVVLTSQNAQKREA